MANVYHHSLSSQVQYPQSGGLPVMTDASRFKWQWTARIFNPDMRNSSSWFSRLASFKRKKVDSPIQVWDEKTLELPRDTTTSAATAAAGQTITPTNIDRWNTRMVVINNRTREQILITAMTATTVTLGVRSFGGVAAAAILVGDEFTLLNCVRQEISGAVPSRTRGTTEYFNILQEDSDTLDMSKKLKGWTRMEGEAFKLWDQLMEEKEVEYRRKQLIDFFHGQRAADVGTGVGDQTFKFGGFRDFATNSTVNGDLGGAPLTKNDMLDYITNFTSVNGADTVDMIARPEIIGSTSRWFESQLRFNDEVPSKIKINKMQSIQYAGCTVNLHAEKTLKECNDNAIYVVDTSKYDGDTAIQICHMPTGGGKENTNGLPTWIFNQGQNDVNADKAQIISHWCPLFVGAATGRIAYLDHVGW